MGLFDDVGRADVLSALEEYDQLGADEFLGRYGFARGDDYVLWHDGRTFDSRATLAVARKFAGGTAATAGELAGDLRGAARLLAELGFLVTSADPYAGVGGPVTGSWREASDTGLEASHAAWAGAARDVLLQAARRYRSVVTVDELATQVMYRTGIRTGGSTTDWLADVLRLLAEQCVARDEPLLPSLCVRHDGRVTEQYAVAVGAATGFPPPDAAEHAARQRLECYRHFKAAGLPADGGAAARAPRAARPRTPRAAKPAPSPSRATRTPPAPVATCPTCYMALPVTGVCDTCG